jgi:hypothetical protein
MQKGFDEAEEEVASERTSAQAIVERGEELLHAPLWNVVRLVLVAQPLQGRNAAHVIAHATRHNTARHSRL